LPRRYTSGSNMLKALLFCALAGTTLARKLEYNSRDVPLAGTTLQWKLECKSKSVHLAVTTVYLHMLIHDNNGVHRLAPYFQLSLIIIAIVCTWLAQHFHLILIITATMCTFLAPHFHLSLIITATRTVLIHYCCCVLCVPSHSATV
jgi:hypothetical protein